MTTLAPPHHDRETLPARRTTTPAGAAEVSQKDDDEHHLDADDYADLLNEFAEADDLDDQEASDIDAGVGIEEPVGADGEDDGDLPLDTEGLIDAGRAESFAGEEDTGPEQLDIGVGLDDLPPLEDDEPEHSEGLDGMLDDLPALEEEDDGESAVDPAQLLDLEDDQTVAPRDPWLPLRLDLPTGARRVAEATGDGLLLAGTALERWARDGTREELLQLRATIQSCVGSAQGFLLSTVTGEVLRFADGLVTPVDGWRQAAGLAPDQVVSVRLVGTTGRALLLESSGSLVATRDGGETWEPVVVPGKVLSISREPPHWMVVDDARGVVLLREQSDDGMAYEPSADVRQMLRPGCLLVAREPAIAIAARGHGVALSADGAKTFEHIPGLSTVTAMTLGPSAEGPQLFVATFSAAGNTAWLHRVDVRTRRITLLGDIRASDDDDDAAVVALAFDDAERSLWAVGSFGVRVFGRPD